MKKYAKYFDIFIWILLIGATVRFFLGYYGNQQNIGVAFQEFQVKAYGDEDLDVFKMLPGKTLLLWATWCGPCKFEINRINNAIKKGELEKDQVVGILVSDTESNLSSFLEKEEVLFPLFIDKNNMFIQKIELQGTPTFLQLDSEMKIKKIWTGISPFLISKIKDS